jgi:hypothetical protein
MAWWLEELRTVMRIASVRAEDCLVVDTFEFSFRIWCVAIEKRWGKNPGPALLVRAGPQLNFVEAGSRD